MNRRQTYQRHDATTGETLAFILSLTAIAAAIAASMLMTVTL